MTDESENAAGAYSLDALSDDERRRFEEHLASDPGARSEIDEFRATAARLGAAEASPPPEALKGRVLSEIETTRQVAPEDGSVVALRHPERAGWRRASVTVAAIAAAITLIAGAAFVAVEARSRADNADRIVAVFADPATELVDLTGDAGAALRVAWSPTTGEGVLLGDVSSPPGDRTYELWFVTSEVPAPGPLFRPDADGHVEKLFTADLRDVDTLAVTEEPAGGSVEPTGEMLLVGSVSV